MLKPEKLSDLSPERRQAIMKRSMEDVSAIFAEMRAICVDISKRGDAVTLITMHSCKGLEFPHVCIVGLEDGLLPHARSKVEGTLDEERRLFYVGITRAMQTLTISHCGGRKKYGQLLPCQPSPFLKELPEELVETSDSKSKTPVAQDSGKNLFAAMREAIA